jgi:hypothetical protein
MQKVMIRRIIYIVESIDLFVIDHDDGFNEALQKDPGPALTSTVSEHIYAFYTGLVDLLLVIANNADGYVPDTQAGNKKLYQQLARDSQNRNAILSEEVMDKLLIYESVYKKAGRDPSKVDWYDLKPLVKEVHIIWSLVKLKTEQLIIDLLKTT